MQHGIAAWSRNSRHSQLQRASRLTSALIPQWSVSTDTAMYTYMATCSVLKLPCGVQDEDGVHKDMWMTTSLVRDGADDIPSYL